MKIEVTKLQAKLNSEVPLESDNNLENLSLHIKLLGEFSAPEHNTLQSEASQRESIDRLLSGQQAMVDSGVELLH